jgi:hypothetical protein
MGMCNLWTLKCIFSIPFFCAPSLVRVTTFLASCLYEPNQNFTLHIWTLKMKVGCSSQTSVSAHKTRAVSQPTRPQFVQSPQWEHQTCIRNLYGHCFSNINDSRQWTLSFQVFTPVICSYCKILILLKSCRWKNMLPPSSGSKWGEIRLIGKLQGRATFFSCFPWARVFPSHRHMRPLSLQSADISSPYSFQPWRWRRHVPLKYYNPHVGLGHVVV